MTDLSRPHSRISDEQMAAPLTHGATVTHSRLAFCLDFLLPDESGQAEWLVARRVLVDPTAMPGLINLINLQWNEYQMEYGQPDVSQ